MHQSLDVALYYNNYNYDKLFYQLFISLSSASGIVFNDSIDTDRKG